MQAVNTRIGAALLAATVMTGFAITAADAAPRLIFRGKATWTTPSCLKMKATNGITYQLIDAGPAFPPDTCVLVVAERVGDVGLCFSPVAQVTGFRVLPGGCGLPIKKPKRR